MTGVDPLDETLELARATLAPSFADDARLRRALGLTPGSLPSPVTPPRVSAPRAGVLEPRAWRALRASGSAGILAGAVLAGLGFGAGLWLSPDDGRLAAQPVGERAGTSGSGTVPPTLEPRVEVLGDDLPPHEDTALREDTALHEDTAEPPEPSPPLHQPSARREARVPRHGPSRAHAASPASEELALLRRVQRALRAQNPALALALIAELDQRFPETRLAEEREAAHVIAACDMEEGGARLRAERFLRDRGGSVYAERVREACGISAGSVRSEGSARPGDQ